MAISLASISRTSANRPPIVLIHGGPGIGKTTFAANAPNPIFIRTEDGLGNLSVDAFPVATSFSDVMAAVGAVYSAEAGRFNWIVVDSMSALEPLIWDHVAKTEGKPNVEALGFGKGYVLALSYWQQLLSGLSALATDKGVGSLLIAHTDIVRYESPEVDSYDRAAIKLHKRAFQLMYERCDIIGYASQRVSIRKDGDGFKERKMGVGDGARFLHLVEKPAFVAKNRYSLPESIPFQWDAFNDALMASVAPAAAAMNPVAVAA